MGGSACKMYRLSGTSALNVTAGVLFCRYLAGILQVFCRGVLPMFTFVYIWGKI